MRPEVQTETCIGNYASTHAAKISLHCNLQDWESSEPGETEFHTSPGGERAFGWTLRGDGMGGYSYIPVRLESLDHRSTLIV